jgi:hypothetical protein
MGKDYRGVGYLTGRRLSFNSGGPGIPFGRTTIPE